jgi:ElaB/YqjD/DUF883 family membrane-anchored ribosome-binding protein
MPPRDPELPEGTDHIITGAMETGTGPDAVTNTPASPETGIISRNSDGDDTGGTAANGAGGPFRDSIDNLRRQATDRVRQFADDGKTRASDALDELSRVVEETADTIEERLGGDYAGYARKAADAVSEFSTTLRQRDVEELYQDAEDLVRRSPSVALGVAAVVGFTLVRLIKAGIPDGDGDGSPGGSGKGSRGRKRASADA